MITEEEQKSMGETLEKILDESFEKLTEIWPKIKDEKEEDSLMPDYEKTGKNGVWKRLNITTQYQLQMIIFLNQCAKHIGTNL